jgi:predicted regulator of Ras-like GTPase activity (Roadblock/LC7/MglB family)
MGFQGNFSEENLQEILQKLSLNKESGELLLKNNSDRGCIFFQNGRIISACSYNSLRTFRNELLEANVVTATQWGEFSDQYSDRSEPELFMGILEDLEISSSPVGLNILEKGTKSAVYEFLDWNDGIYKFITQNLPDISSLSLHVEHVLMEWLQRCEEREAREKEAQRATDIDPQIKLLDALEKELKEEFPEKLSFGKVKPKNINQLLDLFTNLPAIKYACILSRDGLYHGTNSDLFPYSVSALASNAWGMIASFGDEIFPDQALKSIYLQFKDNIVIFQLIDPQISLIIIAEKEVNLKYIKWITLKSSESILEYLKD